MPLTIYRRHNPQKCSSRDSQHCANKRRPCPIWVRGSKPDGTYIREPLKYRDWTKAQDALREMEVTGKLPKVTPSAEDNRTTIEKWRDRFLENARTENISEETLRKYRLLFKQLLTFAQNKGIRFVTELDLPTLQDFRTTWKDKPLSKSKKQERLRSVFKFAAAHKWIEENPAIQLGRIKVERTQQIPFSADEMEAILVAAREVGPEVYTFILTMRFSGLRISDVCTLRADSLQGDHLVLRTEKTGTPVKVLLPRVVANALRTIRKENSEYFFWNGRSKLASITDYWRTRRIKVVFGKAKIKSAHPHRFRHTFAVELLKQGTPAGTVAILLGNTEQIVIKHYSAWIEARQKGLDEAVKKANGYHDIEPVSVGS
ncbi:MAG: tyrosine-type recombinase/integrase [Candidatus Acidiferrales bacterium]